MAGLCIASDSIFQNEKKKDKELTLRIEKILKRRDEVIKGVDLSTPSRSCFLDQILTKATDKIEAIIDQTVIGYSIPLDSI